MPSLSVSALVNVRQGDVGATPSDHLEERFLRPLVGAEAQARQKGTKLDSVLKSPRVKAKDGQGGDEGLPPILKWFPFAPPVDVGSPPNFEELFKV